MGRHHHFVFSQKLLEAQGCVDGGIVSARTNPHSATFLDDFFAGSHAIFSTHSSKTSGLQCVLEKQTPCALSRQHKKNQHSLATGANLSRYYWSLAYLVTSTDLIAALTQGRSRRTNCHHLLQLL